MNVSIECFMLFVTLWKTARVVFSESPVTGREEQLQL